MKAVNEAHIMERLKHPFVVAYHNSFIESNNLNILMEFCDGGDLCFFLKQQNKKHLKEDKIWKFFIEICMGLEYIHRNKILHRDIKTLNIFLNKDETVKIGDLGVAKALNANDFAHTMVGTPFYLSPELCE
jgi:NIMA (never in mitosis gene a)-related kinase